jgi:hypothetical protein
MLTFRAGEHRVISMEMLGKIRRMYFRDKLSLHQIAKRTGLSRNTIRKLVRAPKPLSQRTNGAQPSISSALFTRPWSRRSRPIRSGQKITAGAPKHFLSRSRPRVMTAVTGSSRHLCALGDASKASLYALLYR